jgi:hypothetical protein
MDRQEEILQELRALRDEERVVRHEANADLLAAVLKWFIARTEALEAELGQIRGNARRPAMPAPADQPEVHQQAKLAYAPWATYPGFREHLCDLERQVITAKREPTWEAVTALLAVGPRQVIRHMQAWGLRPPQKREKNPDWPPSTWPPEPRKVLGRRVITDTFGHLAGLSAALLPIGFDLLYDSKVDHAMRLCRAVAERMIAAAGHS